MAILAHPGLIGDEGLIRNLVAAGLQGLKPSTLRILPLLCQHYQNWRIAWACWSPGVRLSRPQARTPGGTGWCVCPRDLPEAAPGTRMGPGNRLELLAGERLNMQEHEEYTASVRACERRGPLPESGNLLGEGERLRLSVTSAAGRGAPSRPARWNARSLRSSLFSATPIS